MSSTDPKEKIARSKDFSSGWSMSNILRNEKEMDSVLADFLSWMDVFAESGKPFLINQWLSFVASDVVGDQLFSERFGFLKEGRDIGGSIANTGMFNAYAAIMGFYRWIHFLIIGNPIMGSFVPMGHLFDTSMQALERRRKNKDSRFDIVSHWQGAAPSSYYQSRVC